MGRPAFAYGNMGELLDTNVNRSPSAYENNPPEERARYAYSADKDMMLVKLVGTDGSNIGAINWFRTC
jgi:neutral ceramidase